MWPTLLDWGGIEITVFGLSLVMGFVLGGFVMWRRLRDDYDGEQLLTLWLWLVISAWVGSGVWVWWASSELRQLFGAVGLPTVVLVVWSRRYRWNFWELLDVWGPVSLAMMVLAAIGWGPMGSRPALAAVGGVTLVSMVRKLYRRWRWYPSGKVGVVGIVAVAGWAVVNLVVANFHLWAVYSLSWMLVAAIVAIYLRSGRHISDDLAPLWTNLRKLRLKK